MGAINIRRLASEANIAVGTVYNYFESKQEVLLALTEAYWQNALEEMRVRITAERFPEQIGQIIHFLRLKMNDCAKILMRSLRDDAETAQIRMAAMQRVLKRALVERLDRDTAIRAGVWDKDFTKESFAEFVLINLVMLMQQADEDEGEGMLLRILERILY